MTTKTRMTITIDTDLYKDIAEMSRKDERSISNQIVYLVRKGKEVTETQDAKSEG